MASSDESVSQSVGQLICEPAGQSVNQSASASQFVSRTSICEPASQSVGASVGTRAGRSVSQSGGRQSVCQCLRYMMDRYRQMNRYPQNRGKGEEGEGGV